MSDVPSASSDFEAALLSYNALSSASSDGVPGSALPLPPPAPLLPPSLLLSSPSASPPTHPRLFLSFLALAQYLEIDILPLTWHSALLEARRGGTAQLYQMAIDIQSAFAFKRPSPLRGEKGQADLLALCTELGALGLASLRECKNVVALEGIAWDVEGKSTQPWPVLVFEKADWGDLMMFMERGAGRELGLRERLELCADVLVAVGVLHGSCITHGDIKPQNVLVFDDEDGKGQYVAKVADFGYSGMLMVDGVSVTVHGTEGWAAPEYTKGMRADFEAARRFDVFSLGWLCLWLLFYNKSENGIGGTTSDFLAHRRSKTSLVDIATKHIELSEGIDEGTRKNLNSFFQQTLQHDPALRVVDCQTLLGLIAPHRTTDSQALPARLDDMEILTPTFKLDKSITQLLLADYRVPKYITQCLKSTVESADLGCPSDSTDTSTSTTKPYAFELALCYKIGFGADRDEAASEALAKLAGIPMSVIEDSITNIKQVSNTVQFKSVRFRGMIADGKDFRMNLSAMYLQDGHLGDAITQYSKDVENMSVIFGPAHFLTLIVSTTLCYALRMAGQWDEAVTRRIELTELMSQTRGEHDAATLASRSELAAMYMDMDELGEAEKLLLQVREVQLTLDTENGNRSLETAHALAEIYRRRGKWQEAEDLLVPAVKLRERLLGPKHPDTLRLVSRLASLYLSQQRIDDAQELLEQLVENRKWRLGNKHHDTLSSMSNLASVYYHQDRLADAKKLYEHIEAVQTEMLGDEHKSTLIARSNLASLYKKLGKYDQAEVLEERTLEAKIRNFGKDNNSVLTTQGNLALTYAFQKKWDKARALGAEVVETKRRVLGLAHPSTLRSICNLAEAYAELGRTEEAKTLLEQGYQDALDAGREGEYEVELVEAALWGLSLPETEDGRDSQ